TYTTGITNSSFDVLRYGDEAYFVAAADSRGCATGWSGINLVTGNPVAAPSVLSDHPIQSAAISPYGLVVTTDGACTTPSKVQTYTPGDVNAEGKVPYRRDYATPLAAHVIAVSPTGGGVAYVRDGVDNPGSVYVTVNMGLPPDISIAKRIVLPEGCTATALAYAGTDLVAGVTCAQSDGTTVLTVLRWDSNGTLLMRKDVTTKFKEAAISDIAVVGQDIYYVVNAEGLESYLYKLGTTKTDATVPATNLFHIAAQP
ncbi:MAG: hypothetical protein QOG52_2634, partial [Frankiaceae bacterium]|nr:hypothetical protein [Frankiaceae bacterium]